MEQNPYQSPPSHDNHRQTSGQGAVQAIGTAVLIGGVVTLAYGALAFWVFPFLPPNGGVNGRLPSLYTLGIGIVATLVGLALRGLRSSRASASEAERPSKGIPTGIGILVLIAIIIAVFVAISRL